MNDIKAYLLENGATTVGEVIVPEIHFEPEFRKACESNACGKFGRCWTCPPDIGDVNVLICKAREYQTALVYQTIHDLEDSYDFEGMQEGGDIHNKLAQLVNTKLNQTELDGKYLHLSAGGCRVCPKCAKEQNTPCRFPDKAMASLEAFGIDVSQLAKLSGMNYINGQDTVTYFGAILYK